LRLLWPGRREAAVGGRGRRPGAPLLQPRVRAAVPRLRDRATAAVTAVTTSGMDALVAGYLERLAARTPRSHELRRDAEQVLAGGVSSHFKAWQPFYVREAKGSHLTDVDGNDYVDLVMGFGPNPLGHSAPVVMDA